MRITVLAGVLVATALVAACKDERSITTQPVGSLAYGQNLIKQGTNLPRGRTLITGNTPLASATTPATDSVIVELAGIDSLSTGQYVVWVGNDSATKFARITGNLTIVKLDTTINAQGDPVFRETTSTVTNVNGFRNGAQNYRMRFAGARTASGLAATDSASLVIVSVEPGTVGTAPGERRFLWSRRGTGTVSADTVTLNGQLRRISAFKFGNFAPRITDEYVYAQSTVARVAFPATNFASATTPNIPRGRIEVRGNIFTVNDSNYYRPPVGFFYEAWAIRVDTLGRFIDTVSLGRNASPFPNRISFYEADKTIPDPQFMFGTPTPVIYASQERVSSDTIPAFTTVTPFGSRPYTGIGFVYVVLQNKAGPVDRMGAAAVLTTSTPGSILGR